MEETSKMLVNAAKVCSFEVDLLLQSFPKQAKTSFDHAAPSKPTALTGAAVNSTVLTDAGVHEAWTDHARERDKARKQKAERINAKLESESEFTIKSNSHLSSAMTLVLSIREAAAIAEVEGPGAGTPGRRRGRGRGEGERREGLDGGWGGWAGHRKCARLVRDAVLKQQTTRTRVDRPAG